MPESPAVDAGIVDTHLHAKASDNAGYHVEASAPPAAPGMGESVEDLMAAMTSAGVRAAVLVQWNSRHGYDNSYAADMAVRHPATFASVCSLDVEDPHARSRTVYWLSERHMHGIRLFNSFPTPGRTDDVRVDDPRSLAVIDQTHALGGAVTVMTAADGLDAVYRALESRPDVPLILDHVTGAEEPADLDRLAAYPNAFCKFSTGVLADVGEGLAPGPVLDLQRARFEALIRRFGADRLMWGSNYPRTSIPYSQLVQSAADLLVFLSPHERALVMGANACRFWPTLSPSTTAKE